MARLADLPRINELAAEYDVYRKLGADLRTVGEGTFAAGQSSIQVDADDGGVLVTRLLAEVAADLTALGIEVPPELTGLDIVAEPAG